MHTFKKKRKIKEDKISENKNSMQKENDWKEIHDMTMMMTTKN